MSVVTLTDLAEYIHMCVFLNLFIYYIYNLSVTRQEL